MTWIYDMDSNGTCGPKGSIGLVSDENKGRRILIFKIGPNAQIGARSCTLNFMKIRKGTTPPAGWWNKPQRKIVMRIDA